jgi:3-mercaptopyruvate sulfurtransferase SseA
MMAPIPIFGADAMTEEIDWTGKVKGILKAELKRRNVTYAQLAEKLGEIGVKETETNIRNKIARGGFTAVFFIQCLEAIGATDVRLR